jgi:dipeptide/tripeptide permease
MSQPVTTGADHRSGLFAQIQDLDNRFWIVNVMEMFERLAYYGVRAVVAIYMVLPRELGGPEFTHVQKGTIFAWWAYIQSVLPMFTGGFADRYGHKNTIAFAIVLKIIGYGLMGVMMDFNGFFLGCAFLAAGTAVFKPGVQGTLAATLKKSSASVGWGIFYQLVNIGGFLGPVIAGLLRLLDWKYVFFACALIVSVNFLWLPFYKDPTQEEGHGASAEDGTTWAPLARAIPLIWAKVGTGVFVTLLVGFGVSGFVGEDGPAWMMLITVAILSWAFGYFWRHKQSLDAGRSDPLAVLAQSSVGLFQPRVFMFCLVFSGFWLMFNQVFDLLPNMIDDWVDSSGIILSVGNAFSGAAFPTVLAVLLGVLFGGICATGVLLSMRPDRRPVTEVTPQTYAVVWIAALGACWTAAAVLTTGAMAFGLAVGMAAIVAAGAKLARVPAKPLAIGLGVVGAVTSFVKMREVFIDSAPELVSLSNQGAQVPPEWMINLNPGLIIFTMIGFAYLSSFVRPLTSIIIGMVVATLGSLVAGTAVIGWVCIGGIAIFSIGEMLSSPKKMEYLATLSPKGQEGLFMGYANIPVAIGWIAGSYLAGGRYEDGGDKANLARKHLQDVVGWSADKAEALQRSEVVDVLGGELGMTAMEVQRLLYATYSPQAIWIDIAYIGAASIVAMIIYDRVLRWFDGQKAAP